MNRHSDFWNRLSRLFDESEIKIDRPKGSHHPRYPDMIYPLDYGYLEGTRSGDGAGIDVWVGSLSEKKVTGVVLCVDNVKRDTEVKVLLGCTQEEAEEIVALHNSGGQSAILVERRGE